jgi:hypothetical protein
MSKPRELDAMFERGEICMTELQHRYRHQKLSFKTSRILTPPSPGHGPKVQLPSGVVYQLPRAVRAPAKPTLDKSPYFQYSHNVYVAKAGPTPVVQFRGLLGPSLSKQPPRLTTPSRNRTCGLPCRGGKAGASRRAYLKARMRKQP